MPVIARTNAPRPPLHGRVVEVHQRRGLFGPTEVYDLHVILWSPRIGAHDHVLTVRGRSDALTIAARIGQAPIQLIT